MYIAQTRANTFESLHAHTDILTLQIQGGVESQDALSLQVIFRKRAL